MVIFASSNPFLIMASQKFRMAEDIDFKDIIKAIVQAIYIILLIYVAFQVLRAIFGGTWATENIIIASMGLILGGMFVIVGFLINQGKCLGILEERTKNMGDSLSNMGKDLKNHLTNYKK